MTEYDEDAPLKEYDAVQHDTSHHDHHKKGLSQEGFFGKLVS
jgi:hypothetical protein